MKKLFVLSIMLFSSAIAMQQQEEKKAAQFFPDVPREKIEFTEGLLGLSSEAYFRRFYGHAPAIFAQYSDTIIEKKLGVEALEFYKKNPDHESSEVFKRYAMAVAYRLQNHSDFIRSKHITDEELKRAESIVPFNWYELHFIEHGTKGKNEGVEKDARRAYLNAKLYELRNKIVQK